MEHSQVEKKSVTQIRDNLLHYYKCNKSFTKWIYLAETTRVESHSVWQKQEANRERLCSFKSSYLNMLQPNPCALQLE